jgi:hypothetical protein
MEQRIYSFAQGSETYVDNTSDRRLQTTQADKAGRETEANLEFAYTKIDALLRSSLRYSEYMLHSAALERLYEAAVKGAGGRASTTHTETPSGADNEENPSSTPEKFNWKPHTIYLVDVSWRKGNPVHRAILHTGFIEKSGIFGGYCEVWSNCYEGSNSASNALYLKAVKELATVK